MDQEKWTRIRTKVILDGQSKRSVAEEEDLNFRTVQKMVNLSIPPGYRRNKALPERKISPFIGWIEQVLEEDKTVHRKQRHSAIRIFERLRAEKGYTGGYTMVREEIKAMRNKQKEVFVPLVHRAGEAQVDFGHAAINVGGKLGKYPFFVMSLPYSDAFYIQVFPTENTETFQEGHRRAFNYFGKVPSRISYDNSKVAVSKILGCRARKLTDGFLSLQSHYLFKHHFCRVARGNEKGVVEGMVKYTRSHFLVPVPQVDDLEVLNRRLEESCRLDLQRKLRGKTERKEALLIDDLNEMRSLPPGEFEACRKISTTSSSLSLVRFECNDYSVPVRHAHRTVLVKGYCNEIRIYASDELIAQHKRLWIKESVAFDPIHYLALLEKKPGALDFARPLEKWNLPDCFVTLRKRLEDQCQGEGVREYIKVLRLLEKHSLDKLRQAVVSSLRHGGLTSDAIAQYLYPRGDYADVKFCLNGHPHLHDIQVDPPKLSSYNDLLNREVSL